MDTACGQDRGNYGRMAPGADAAWGIGKSLGDREVCLSVFAANRAFPIIRACAITHSVVLDSLHIHAPLGATVGDFLDKHLSMVD